MDDQFLIEGGRRKEASEQRRAAEMLVALGLVCYRPTRPIGEEAESELRQMFIDYFRQPNEVTATHERPGLSYQVGHTPEHVERPIPVPPEMLAQWGPDDQPHPVIGKDPKRRYFVAVGETPPVTQFPEFSALTAVIPEAFKEVWMPRILAFHQYFLREISDFAEMVARGFGLEPDALSRLMRGAPHLFAPTGSNLAKFGTPGTVLAGAHTDLNLFTGHMRSNYPGLRAWTSQGKSFWVKVPEGCILIQAGMQLKYVTGGLVQDGWHEVVAVPEMQPGIERDLGQGLVPYRTTITDFLHAASDLEARVFDRFATADNVKLYPPTLFGHQVHAVLKKIALTA